MIVKVRVCCVSRCRLDYFYRQSNKAVWTATTSLLVRLLNNLKSVEQTAHSTQSPLASFLRHYTMAQLTTQTPMCAVIYLTIRISHTYSIYVCSLPYYSLSLSHSQPLVQEAEVRLIEMVHQMLADGNLKFAQLLRNALVAKVIPGNDIHLNVSQYLFVDNIMSIG